VLHRLAYQLGGENEKSVVVRSAID
jgi:hypothetical protein